MTDRPADGSSPWPPHAFEVRPWRQVNRGGTREDRMLTEVRVALPPRIATLDVPLSTAVAAQSEAAIREITSLDHEHGSDLQALGVLLLRTESVASSKIEAVEASLDDYARALHGSRSNPSATAMVAATEALSSMISGLTHGTVIRRSLILDAHRALLRGDTAEAAYAGRFRDMQNWIGGSDYSPRGALYVPPPPETVEDSMDDVLAFANRDDLPALSQAAVAHAQFESIHPFTDGNGRIGRALVNAILRRRGTTTRVVVPLASALVARREHYFSLLDRYRDGEIEPLIAAFAEAAAVAAAQSRVTARRLAELPEIWSGAVGPVRRGSATTKLLDVLLGQPVLSADDAIELTEAPRSSVFDAITRLAETGILRPLTDRQRNQVWGAAAVLDELDDLGMRIAIAVRGS